MNQRFEQSPRCSATGATTVSILALIVAMAISVFFDFRPSDKSVHTAARHSISARA